MENKIKRKRKQLFLLTGVDCLTQDEAILTLTEIKKKIKKIFRSHIGQDNAITPYDLFYEVFNVNPALIDIFKRNYWYSVLKRVISQMRREGDCFIINRGSSLFVLQTQEESNKFKEGINRHISYLKEIKYKADFWVRRQKWKELI